MLRVGLILLIATHLCLGARILGVVPTTSYSHQIIFQPIFKELAKRGHELVVMTADPQKDPSIKNLKEIDWNFTYELWRKNATELIKSSKNPFNFVQSIVRITEAITTQQLEYPEVTALINNKTEHFDLVMIEFLLPTMFAFKHRFNCPFIGMTSLDTSMVGHMAVGNAVHQILYPEPIVPFNENMNFLQRLFSFSLSHFFVQYMDFICFDDANNMIRKYFGEGYPDLRVLRDSVDMIFINVNPVFHNIRPITPATITIGGGIHIKELKPLPKDLQHYLDSAKDGVIYFSLGSNVKSTDIPLDIRDIILKVFSELPYKILWKFESDELLNKPDNVKIQKWIPQQDVLRHPNVKVFITQGGLQSLEEALFSHIPLVVMPFFGDQDFNAKKVVSKGMGVSVEPKTLTSEQFKEALLEVITNSKYKNKIKELATLVRDEPMNALDKAVWWTEYVLRNKGAQHLKGPGLNLPLYQYYYLDIISFLVVVFAVIIGTIYFTIKKIINILCKFLCKKKAKVQ